MRRRDIFKSLFGIPLGMCVAPKGFKEKWHKINTAACKARLAGHYFPPVNQENWKVLNFTTADKFMPKAKA